MKTATEKNLDALTKLLGNATLAERVEGAPIRVITTNESDTASGKLLAEALGDVLGRLWVNFEREGPLADVFASAASKAAESGDKPIKIGPLTSGAAAATVRLGLPDATCGPEHLCIGANGWRVSAGARVNFGSSIIPVGPAFAAALAGAEVFKIVFADAFSGKSVERLDTLDLNLWTFGRGPEPNDSTPVDFGDVHVFGLGAVTHGLLWSLERWPAPMTGYMRLIDHDTFDAGNGQRYGGLVKDAHGLSKADFVAARVTTAQPGINAYPFKSNLDQYFDLHEAEPRVLLAVVGLDSAEARRHAALKLPKRGVNMWTEGFYLGSSRFGGWDRWPCLMCKYPEQLTGTKDEVGTLSTLGRLGLSPKRIRDLLDNLEPVTDSDARVLSQHLGLSAADMTGKPLRTVLHQLCATGHVTIARNEEADVPLAFSSLLAGTLGFINLLSERIGGPNDDPYDWQFHVLGVPTEHLVVPSAPNRECALCAGEPVDLTVHGVPEKV